MLSEYSTIMLDRLHSIFIAIVTLTCVLGTLEYWSLLMGISQDGALRFDTAPTHWRVAGVILCLLLPLTALGVWFRNGFGRWGWLLVTAIHILMYGFMSEQFGTRPILLGVSILILLILICFQLLLYRRAKTTS